MLKPSPYQAKPELLCYYWCWCWCSVLGDLIIPADSLSTSLGIGLSITLKAGVELLRWLWGAVAQWSEPEEVGQSQKVAH